MYTVEEKRFRFASNTWNPRQKTPFKQLAWAGGKVDHSHGVRVNFWGSPSPEHRSACDAAPETGKARCMTPECFKKFVYPQRSNTDDLYITGQAWTNQKYLPKCPESDEDYGRTFVALSPFSLALFSYTGKNADDKELPFLQTNQIYSTNPDLQASYISMAASDGHMKPFSGRSKTMVIRSRQQVAKAKVPSNCAVQQKQSFVLHNVNDPTGQGRIEYAPNIYMQGTYSNFRHARVQSDPNQGNHTFVGGNFAGGGEVTNLDKTNLPAWKTWGRGTQNVPMDRIYPFRMSIPWDWFVTTLIYATTKRGLNGKDVAQVAKVFGPGWNVPENWELKNIRWAQEVKNPNLNSKECFIGGQCQMFQIDAK